MEKVRLNSDNKKQNGLEQIENEKHKSLARARALLPWGGYSPNQWMNYLHNLLHLQSIYCPLGWKCKQGTPNKAQQTCLKHIMIDGKLQVKFIQINDMA